MDTGPALRALQLFDPSSDQVAWYNATPTSTRTSSREIPMTEERKYAVLFAATLLCARKLMELGDRPSPAKFAMVEDAISNANFIMDRIDKEVA